MATPAFIYAFDNLGPARFTEICGLLLGSQYKGFLLGGVGPDGGIDAEIDNVLGVWQPETISPLLTEVIRPGRKVVFQFKHKVTSRVGQGSSRQQLLAWYRCTANRQCELHKELISRHNPDVYVLVTNIEVNSVFRSIFIETCQQENPNIEHYQIVGLDELETWITNAVQLRHLYFPTIFGAPRFNLEVQLTFGFAAPYYGNLNFDFENSMDVLCVSVLNTGSSTSYFGQIKIKTIVDGAVQYAQMLDFDNEMTRAMGNPASGTAIEPGRKLELRYPYDVLRRIRRLGEQVFPFEVMVQDEINNIYSSLIPAELRGAIWPDSET